MLKGRLYTRANVTHGSRSEYVRDYRVFSFDRFVEQIAVNFVLDKYERFALTGSNPTNPGSVFVSSNVSNDAVEEALASEYGIDAKLVD
jgi:hypothetical protein